MTAYEEFVFSNNPNMHIDFSYKLNNYGHRCDNFKNDCGNGSLLFAGCSFTFGEGLPYKSNWSGILYDKLSFRNEDNYGYYSLGYCGGSNYLIAKNIISYIENFGKPEAVFALFPESSRKTQMVNEEELVLIPYQKQHKESIWGKRENAFINTYKTIYKLNEYLKKNNINFVWSFWDEFDRKRISKYPAIPGYVDMSERKILNKADKNTGSRYYDIARDFAHPGICYNSGVANIFMEKYYDFKTN